MTPEVSYSTISKPSNVYSINAQFDSMAPVLTDAIHYQPKDQAYSNDHFDLQSNMDINFFERQEERRRLHAQLNEWSAESENTRAFIFNYSLNPFQPKHNERGEIIGSKQSSVASDLPLHVANLSVNATQTAENQTDDFLQNGNPNSDSNSNSNSNLDLATHGNIDLYLATNSNHSSKPPDLFTIPESEPATSPPRSIDSSQSMNKNSGNVDGFIDASQRQDFDQVQSKQPRVRWKSPIMTEQSKVEDSNGTTNSEIDPSDFTLRTIEPLSITGDFSSHALNDPPYLYPQHSISPTANLRYSLQNEEKELGEAVISDTTNFDVSISSEDSGNALEYSASSASAFGFLDGSQRPLTNSSRPSFQLQNLPLAYTANESSHSVLDTRSSALASLSTITGMESDFSGNITFGGQDYNTSFQRMSSYNILGRSDILEDIGDSNLHLSDTRLTS